MPTITVFPISNRNIKTISQEIEVPADVTGPIKITFPMPLQDKTDPTNTLTLELDVFDQALNDFRHSVSFTWIGGDRVGRDGTPNPDPAITVSGGDYAGKRTRMVLDDFTKGMRVGCEITY